MSNSLIRNLSINDIKIDLSDPNQINNKIRTEQETRKNLLNHARMIGCEKEMQFIFNKYDNLLRNCTNEKERSDISKLGILEMYRLLGGGGELYVDGQLVIKED